MSCGFGNIGSSLEALISDIVEDTVKRNFNFYIQFELYGPPVTACAEMDMSTVKLQGIQILQDFLEQTTDTMICKISLNTLQYGFIVDNHRDLKCKFTVFEYLEDDKSNPIGDPLFEVDRKVLLRDPKSIDRDLTATQIKDIFENGDGLMEMELELIDPFIYKLRKVEFQCVFEDVTMEELIRYIAAKLKVEKLHLVPPDNLHRYPQIILPNMEDMRSVFDYLQSEIGLGVYMQGCSYFIQDRILYVFPTHMTEGSKGFVTHFVNTGNNSLRGLTGYHKEDKTDLYVLSEGEVLEEDEVMQGIENVRWGRVVCLSGRVINDWFEVLGSGGDEGRCAVKDRHFADIYKRIEDIPMADADEAESSFVVWDENNPFKVSERISSCFKTRVAMQWHQAIPYKLKPSFPIKYHYEKLVDWLPDGDKQTIAVETDASLEKVYYDIYQRDIMENYPMYSCLASVQLAVDPEPPVQPSHASKK